MKDVLVLMSTYNGEKYIVEQIDSIMNQIGVNVILHIRDDGSSDSTVEIIKKLKYKYKNKIDLIEGENIGWRKSFFELMNTKLVCDYYAFSDQDDKWLPNKLYNAIDKIEKNNASLYVGNVEVTDENLNMIRLHCPREIDMMDRNISDVILNPCMPGGLSYVFKEELRKKVITLSKYYYYGHDTLVLQIGLALGKVVYDSNPCVLYRQHQSNVFGADYSRNRIVKERLNLIRNGNKNSLMKLAEILIENFSAEMFNTEARIFLEDLEKARKSFLYRFVLISKNRIKRENIKRTIALHLKIIMGLL